MNKINWIAVGLILAGYFVAISKSSADDLPSSLPAVVCGMSSASDSSIAGSLSQLNDRLARLSALQKKTGNRELQIVGTPAAIAAQNAPICVSVNLK